MNYLVKGYKIVRVGDRTTLEDYEKEVSNYTEAEKDFKRLRSLGGYVNINIRKIEEAHI